MDIKAVLFDLDGTLLPMDQDEFTKAYFSGISGALYHYGYEPKELIGAIWSGTKAMIMNKGEKTNEQIFWEDFCTHYGSKAKEDIIYFDAFYRNDFDKVREVCGFSEYAKKTVELIKEKGLRTALATNPIFPSIATEKRISWAGLKKEDFEIFTTYENSRYSKPNPKYYLDILDQLKIKPEECLMVGNDVGDDMIVEALGMKVFLLTDCLINKDGVDINRYPHGDFESLYAFINAL